MQVWNWGLNKLKYSYEVKWGRTSDLKFIQTSNGMEIVEATTNGELLLTTILPSGGGMYTTMLHSSRFVPSKLALSPDNCSIVFRATLDGCIIMCDIRNPSTLFAGRTTTLDGRIFSIDHHPFNPQVCVGSDDNHVYVYDLRYMNKELYKMCPQKFIDVGIGIG